MTPPLPIHDHPDAWDGSPRRNGPPRVVMLHHTVTYSLASTVAVLERRGLSTHFIIEPDGTIWRTCDPERRAAHAGAWNDASIGIDVVNPLDVRYEAGARRRGWTELFEAPWAPRRDGRRRYIADTEAALLSTYRLCLLLCCRYEIPWVAPEPGERMKLDPKQHRGIVAHGTVNRNRWDGWETLAGWRRLGLRVG